MRRERGDHLRLKMLCANFTILSCMITITGSGFDDWNYWHFFTFTINYSITDHSEWLLTTHSIPLWITSVKTLRQITVFLNEK
jgi:hypothetical protein